MGSSKMKHSTYFTFAFLAISTLGGCERAGAPSFVLFGAFFPAWLLCAVLGVVAAAGTRVLLVTPSLSGVISYPLAVCAAVGITAGASLWLLLFGW
jgi:hypothetical protein